MTYCCYCYFETFFDKEDYQNQIQYLGFFYILFLVSKKSELVHLIKSGILQFVLYLVWWAQTCWQKMLPFKRKLTRIMCVFCTGSRFAIADLAICLPSTSCTFYSTSWGSSHLRKLCLTGTFTTSARFAT